MVVTPHWGIVTARTRRTDTSAVVNVKVAIQRLTTYSGALTFFLVLALWLDKAYDAYFIAMSYGAFMAGAGVLVLATGIVGAIVDRHYIWPRENGVNSRVMPLAANEAFRSAKHLSELESRGVDTMRIEQELMRRFRMCGLEEWFLECLSTCRSR